MFHNCTATYYGGALLAALHIYATNIEIDECSAGERGKAISNNVSDFFVFLVLCFFLFFFVFRSG